MITYKELMYEMAENIGRSYSPLQNFEGVSKNLYANNVKFAKKTKGIELTIDRNVDNLSETHVTLDHNLKKVIHYSIFMHDSSTLPYPHITQDSADRQKEHPVLPSGYVTDHVYDHWNSQILPLRSSAQQYTTGHDMWVKLTNRAIENKKHVYYVHDDGSHVELSHMNKEKYINEYFGKSDPKYRKRHIVLSHRPFNF